MKVAVIGCGAMGKNHCRVYSQLKGVELVAMCDASQKTATEVGSQFNAKAYTDYELMLESEQIDAISICVPTKMHRDVALYCISKKKHILVEKPIAASIIQAQEMIDAAKKNKIKLMVGHIERFNPVIVEMKRRIKNKELGKIFMVKSERFSPFPKRVLDVGVTLDLSVHDVDVMQYLLEAKITSVYGVNAQRIHSTHEDLMMSIMRFENGCIGTTSCNWITPKIVREISVIGEKGMFKADYLAQQLFFFKNEFTDKYIDWERRMLTITKGDEIEIDIEKKEPLKNELEAFIKCVKENKEPPVSGDDGLSSLKVVLEFLNSSKANKVMNL